MQSHLESLRTLKVAELKAEIRAINKAVKKSKFTDFFNDVKSNGTTITLKDNKTNKVYAGYECNGKTYAVIWNGSSIKSAWATLEKQ